MEIEVALAPASTNHVTEKVAKAQLQVQEDQVDESALCTVAQPDEAFTSEHQWNLLPKKLPRLGRKPLLRLWGNPLLLP